VLHGTVVAVSRRRPAANAFVGVHGCPKLAGEGSALAGRFRTR
jgi:hypothetical protein